jgi:protein tyrosine phosphatase (PTP) superfamily phosphohydrolase (DUF442 family)
LARSRVRRWVPRTLAALLLLLGAFVAGRYGTGNQGTVIAGRVYRSAQLSGTGLSRAIRDRGIRTVINLRGANPDQAWYRQERAATLAAGATQVDVPLASDHWLSREQARTLVELIDTCEPPLLVHCEWGAERTGLFSAFVALLRPGGSTDEALAQFHAWYLFLPVRDGLRMRGHVLAYRRWLAERGRAHSPEVFRHWIRSEYRPGHPSREDWPYDPYPLYVVTRPPKAADRLAGRPVPMR